MTIAVDPVCGMEVEVEATPPALTFEFEGTIYYFCGKGCRLEFADDPKHYLDPAYEPSM
ncbi:MAG TPA: YHS domain-containing protein [Candidatus Acidoferrum sp.]|nr:YHS domain-containing protein [Candidatus Acidoferrum sp.]